MEKLSPSSKVTEWWIWGLNPSNVSIFLVLSHLLLYCFQNEWAISTFYVTVDWLPSCDLRSVASELSLFPWIKNWNAGLSQAGMTFLLEAAVGDGATRSGWNDPPNGESWTHYSEALRKLFFMTLASQMPALLLTCCVISGQQLTSEFLLWER